MVQVPPITDPRLLLVEGNDEVSLFSALIKRLGLTDIDIRAFGGVEKFRAHARTLPTISGFGVVKSIGVVRDADQDAGSAFQSVCDSLRAAGLPAPDAPLQPAGHDLQVRVLIVPANAPVGMMEDVCLASVAHDPAMGCVESFIDCLTHEAGSIPGNIAKARVRAFLTSRGVLEESHFEFIQSRLDQWVAALPSAPTAQKVNAFLASRYRPSLNLGLAAKAGYWDFEHPAFAEMRSFLESL